MSARLIGTRRRSPRLGGCTRRSSEATLRNIAKARREMAGPKPMEVDRVADWREWPDDWHGEHSNQGETEEEHHDEKGGDEAYVYSTSERAVARRVERVSKDIATSVVDSGTRSGIATRARAKEKVSARTVGMAKVMARMDTQARRTAQEREAMARAACGMLVLGVGLRSMSSRIARRTRMSSKWRRTSQRFSSSATFRTEKHWREGWQKMPMKVTLGDFVKDTPRVPIQKTHIGRTGVTKNRFKVLEVDEGDEEEVVNVRQVENSERTASVVCDFEDGKAKNRVQFVNSVIKEEDWASLGVGDIIVESAADESCWPALSRRRKAGGRCC